MRSGYMSVLKTSSILSLLLVPALALTDAHAQVPVTTESACGDLFRRADSNNDRVLSSGESTVYIAALKQQGRPAPQDDNLPQDAFIAACLQGAFAGISLAPPSQKAEDAASGLDEAQVRKLVEQQGYTALTNLRREIDGTWQGDATKDGQAIGIAVDRLGQVTRR
jgi:hypothetical protein